jgi:hypothetical protein
VMFRRPAFVRPTAKIAAREFNRRSHVTFSDRASSRGRRRFDRLVLPDNG